MNEFLYQRIFATLFHLYGIKLPDPDTIKFYDRQYFSNENRKSKPGRNHCTGLNIQEFITDVSSPSPYLF